MYPSVRGVVGKFTILCVPSTIFRAVDIASTKFSSVDALKHVWFYFLNGRDARIWGLWC